MSEAPLKGDGLLASFRGPVGCAPVPAAPLFTLSGTTPEGEPLTVTFGAIAPPGLPALLESPCIERRGDGCLIRAGGREWPVAARAVHLHRGVPAFYRGIEPRVPPWHKRLMWGLLLALAARPLGLRLLRRLRGQTSLAHRHSKASALCAIGRGALPSHASSCAGSARGDLHDKQGDTSAWPGLSGLAASPGWRATGVRRHHSGVALDSHDGHTRGGLVRRLLIAVAVALMPALAVAAHYQDWETGVSEDGTLYYALTMNDSGAAFGEWCSVGTGRCTWMVGMSAGCQNNSAYPILANTDAGAQSLTISCGGRLAGTHLYRYQFMSFADLEHLLRDTRRIGFAIPMQADQFRVVRFSLAGANAAVSTMESAVVRAQRRPRPDTRDSVL